MCTSSKYEAWAAKNCYKFCRYGTCMPTSCPDNCGGNGVCGSDIKCKCNAGYMLNAAGSCEVCKDTINWCG